jgi:hypothetical protein
MEPVEPLNPLQRALLALASCSYARLGGDAREQALAVDRFLVSRRGLALWVVGAGVAAIAAAVMADERLPFRVALPLMLLLATALAIMLRTAAVRPGAFTGWRFWISAGATLLGSYAGILGALLWQRGLRETGWRDVERVFLDAAPAQLMAALGLLGMAWAVSNARRQQMQRELDHLQLVRERDAAARRASEAQLHLLRAQVQPHFIFNTLSAVQHWVDTGDARASALLRELTGFLRGSTEMLAKPEVRLGEELALLTRYLRIMQTRLGERLRFEIEVDDAAREVPIPPGLLITLAENAIEHGVAPSLQGGEVRVRAGIEHEGSGSRFQLVVRNSGAPLDPQWREGVGLANCRERLQHRFGDSAHLALATVGGATEARLVVPVAEARA